MSAPKQPTAVTILMALGLLIKGAANGEGVRAWKTRTLGLRMVLHGIVGSIEYAPQHPTRRLGS